MYIHGKSLSQVKIAIEMLDMFTQILCVSDNHFNLEWWIYSWETIIIIHNSIQSLQNQANNEHLPIAKKVIVGETVCYL